MSQREDKIKRAIDKHAERLSTQPHPLTGRPLSSNEAHQRAVDVARAHEQGRPADKHVPKTHN